MERKNAPVGLPQRAEASGDKTPDATQRLVYQAKWDAEAARDRLQQFVVEVFGDEEGIGVVDETGFLKKGDKSVGVQRQYSGTAGKRENCQIGTFLSYATRHGHVFLDRRLYLPESGSAAPERRAQDKVPEDVVFETKPEQAAKMLQHAWEMGVPMRWVTGDEVYGDSPHLRDAIAEHGLWYVLAVRTKITVWLERPVVAVPGWAGSGRKPTKERITDEAVPPMPISAAVASWPESQWQRLEVAEGEKGPPTHRREPGSTAQSRGLALGSTFGQRPDRRRLLSLQCTDADRLVDLGPSVDGGLPLSTHSMPCAKMPIADT